MQDELLYLLTNRQREVGWLIHKGYTAQEIAVKLGISPNTVRDHKKNIFERLGVNKSTELAGLDIWKDSMEKNSDLSTPTSSSAIYDLNGTWLSKFNFDMHRQESLISGGQFNLEMIESKFKKNSYVGRNLQCRSSTKIVFFHRLQCDVFGNNVLGKWFNTNTNNCGCYQLYIHNNGNMMFGKHLGNASNNKVMCGDWIWIRVKDQMADFEIKDSTKGKQLISFKILDEKLNKFIEEGFAIDLNYIIE